MDKSTNHEAPVSLLEESTIQRFRGALKKAKLLYTDIKKSHRYQLAVLSTNDNKSRKREYAIMYVSNLDGKVHTVNLDCASLSYRPELPEFKEKYILTKGLLTPEVKKAAFIEDDVEYGYGLISTTGRVIFDYTGYSGFKDVALSAIIFSKNIDTGIDKDEDGTEIKYHNFVSYAMDYNENIILENVLNGLTPIGYFKLNGKPLCVLGTIKEMRVRQPGEPGYIKPYKAEYTDDMCNQVFKMTLHAAYDGSLYLLYDCTKWIDEYDLSKDAIEISFQEDNKHFQQIIKVEEFPEIWKKLEPIRKVSELV